MKTPRALPPLLITLLPCLWFWPLLAGQLPDFMDTLTQLHPWRYAAAMQLHEGEWPLLLPNQMLGVPLAANPQVAVWYPPHWPFFAYPHPWMHNLAYLFHYLLAGFGMYRWVRVLVPGSRPAAIFAAMTFQFSGLLVSRLALPVNLYAAAWMPWLFWSVDRMRLDLPERRGFAIARVAALFALQVLAGSPQFSYYAAIALPIYWLWRGGVSRVARTLADGAAAAVLAAGIAAIQLLPTLEWVRECKRPPLEPTALKMQALNGSMMVRALVGGTLDGVIEDTDSIQSVGVGAMLLALCSLVPRRSRRRVFPLAIIGLLGWVLAWGAPAELYAKVLPLYDRFHAPRRALMLWSCVAPAMAGVFVAHLLALRRLRKRQRRWLVPGVVALSLASTALMLPRYERAFTDPRRMRAPATSVDTLPKDTRFITIDPTLRYAHGSRDVGYAQALLPNLAATHGVYDAQGYDPLLPQRLALASRMASRETGVFYPSHAVLFTDPRSRILDLLAVTHVIGRIDLFDPRAAIPQLPPFDSRAAMATMETVRADDRWPIHRRRSQAPLAWSAVEVRPAASAEEALLAHLALRERGSDVTFLEGDAPAFRPSSARIRSVERSGPASYRVRFDANGTEGAACVIVSTLWLPGWTARTQLGDPVELYPANGLLVAALLPRGTELLELSYRPNSFRIGSLVTMLSLLLLLLIALPRRKEKASGGAPAGEAPPRIVLR